MKNNKENNISVSMEANQPKAELVIDGCSVRLNFLTSGSAGGLDDAKMMLKKSLIGRGKSCIEAR